MIRTERQMDFNQRKSSLDKFEEINSCIFILSMITSLFLDCYSVSFQISLPIFPSFFMDGLFYYIVLFRQSWPSTCWSSKSPLECLSHRTPLQSFCASKLSIQHCSRVFSTLMQLGSQLQSIQCGDSSLSFGYF